MKMRKGAIAAAITGAALLFSGCSKPPEVTGVAKVAAMTTTTVIQKVQPLKYNGQTRKVMYLTFDDGPGPYTAQVMDILKQNNIKATFFVVGGQVQHYPDLVKRELKEGHYVGLHSMSHDNKKLYAQEHYIDEMKEDQAIVKNIINMEPHLTRPPYGSMPGLNQKLRDQVAAANFKVWDWTIDSLDWKFNSTPLDKAVPAIVTNIINGAVGNREVVLLHDIHPQTLQALPTIIQKLKEKGYDFEVYNEKDHFPLNFWHDNRL